eukprot:3035488-Amphidinium_carterae.1
MPGEGQQQRDGMRGGQAGQDHMKVPHGGKVKVGHGQHGVLTGRRAGGAIRAPQGSHGLVVRSQQANRQRNNHGEAVCKAPNRRIMEEMSMCQSGTVSPRV